MAPVVWIFSKQKHEQGYILTECLIGLIILTTVCTTLVQVLPRLLSIEQQLSTELVIYQKLYEMKDQSFFHHQIYEFPLHFYDPLPYTVTKQNNQFCASYEKGNNHERTICF